MGRAARWFRSIFGMKNSKEQRDDDLNSSDRRDKKRASFGHSKRDNTNSPFCQNPATIPPSIASAEAAWLKSYYSESEKEQNKRAIAVAAATAAAADAAVAAAQAAIAVVRLTSHGRGTGGRENFAAVRIQTTFRAYLARKALRALRALVKLQALVRGYLVRKQAAATLHGMQALIRAQATVRSKRVHDFRPRRSMDVFEDSSSAYSRRLSASFETKPFDDNPKVVEVDTGRPRSRSRRPNVTCSECGDDPSEWGLTGEECRFSTAQSTPRLTNPPLTHFFKQHVGNNPSYMANTQSSKAKLRSQSAPKQRPETGSKRRLSLSEMIESRNSRSGVRMQRSCSHAQEAINFKMMGKFDKSSDSSLRHCGPRI